MSQIAIGIDIGGSNIVYGFVDRDGNCLEQGSWKTATFPDAKDLVAQVIKEIKPLYHSKNYHPIGIGIGAPNGNYYNGTIEFAPNLPWTGVVPLKEQIEQAMGLQTILTNDANAAAIGEMTFGGAKTMNDFLVVTLGTGLGSGFVANGKLIYGHDGFAGELGHTIIDPVGRPCGCGRNGCLETYVSATGITKTAKELLKETEDPSILRSLSLELSSFEIARAAENKDKLALKAFDITSKSLGLALANAVTITSPKAIFLFGGLANAGDLLFKPTTRYFNENLLTIYKNKIALLPSSIPGSEAGILGAAALAWTDLS